MNNDLSKLMDDKIAKVESCDQLEVKRIRFVCQYIVDNSNLVARVFKDSSSVEDFYGGVFSALNEVQKECLPYIGSTTYNKNACPVPVKLGLAVLKPYYDESPCCDGSTVLYLSPTKKGIRAVEKYRAAQGLLDLATQVKVSQRKLITCLPIFTNLKDSSKYPFI